MKKILFVFSLFLMPHFCDAQNYVYQLLAGDTLTNADSTSYVFDMKSTADMKALVQIALTRVSGTGTVTARIYTTNFAKTNYNHISTTTIGTSTTNSLIQIANSATIGRYIKVVVSQTGTAVTVPRLAYVIRAV